MAGFLSYGTGKGLAVAHDWSKDTENLFQSEALKARAQQEKEQKTAYFAKQLQEGKAVAPANTKRLQDFYIQHNKKVADFVIKNPNFETDVVKMTEFMDLTDQYLNNDIIREDQQVQGEFSKLKTAINNGKLRPEEQFAEMQKYNDYKDGKVKDPYIYAEPQRPDVQGTISNIVKNLPTNTRSVHNADGSVNQVREIKFGPGETYDTIAESVLASDPDSKWQIETGYNSSKLLQDKYKTPAAFLSKMIEQKTDLYNVQTNAGTGNDKTPYPNYDADVLGLMKKMDPNAEYQVLGAPNPNLRVLTSGGDSKGNVPIRAGGEFFDFVTDKNDKNGTPILSKVHINHNMKVIQTYEPVGVKGILMAKSYVNIEVPFGEEELNDEGLVQYHDANTGSIVTKEGLFGKIPSAAQEKEWSDIVKKNVAVAGNLATRYEAAGLKQKKSISDGSGAGGSTTLRPPMVYEGTILQELNTNEQSLRAYQAQFGTPGKMDEWGGEFNITNLLQKNINNPEAFISLSKSNPDEAAQIVAKELMKDPEFAASKSSVTKNHKQPWIYDITTPGESQVEWYNIRTKKFE